MGYNYNQGGMGMPPVAPPTSSNATISLIAGIAGLTVLPTIGSIVAIITGNSAKKEIANSGGTIGGEGLAKAGVIMGWIGLILGLIALCVVAIAFIIPLILVWLGLSAEGYYFIPMLISLI